MTAEPSQARRARESRRIASRLAGFAASATIALIALAAAATIALVNDGSAAELRMQIVQLNETRSALLGSTEGTAAKPIEPDAVDALDETDNALAAAQDALRAAADARSDLPLILVWALCAASIIAVIGTTAYLYASVVRPFMRLESFADEVAQGNFDLPLAYERSNPFGRFTWAFDNMRTEIKRARAAETQAVEQNKTMIAALSHDIKTPIASIRAYSEALELGLARSDEERTGYTETILRKCDEVTELTDDLFLHALADLDVIEVACIETPIGKTVESAVKDFDATNTVRIMHLDEAAIPHDPKRLSQVVENLIANARKYAPRSPIEITGSLTENAYRIDVRDRGEGMLPQDMPFAFDRFYRGGNIEGAPGAGLGLFIAKHLVERMGATIRIEDADPGLRVVIEFPAEP